MPTVPLHVSANPADSPTRSSSSRADIPVLATPPFATPTNPTRPHPPDMQHYAKPRTTTTHAFSTRSDVPGLPCPCRLPDSHPLLPTVHSCPRHSTIQTDLRRTAPTVHTCHSRHTALRRTVPRDEPSLPHQFLSDRPCRTRSHLFDLPVLPFAAACRLATPRQAPSDFPGQSHPDPA